MSEIWKPIPGYEDYEVSNLGQVKSLKNKNTVKILKPSKCPQGYLGVNLRIGQRTTYKKIHHLVLLAFIGPKPTGCCVLHSDDNPGNNKLDNLRYGTHKENTDDMIRNHGQHPRKKEGPQKAKWTPKLSPAQIIQIREDRYQKNMTLPEISAKYKISISYACLIVNKKRGGK